MGDSIADAIARLRNAQHRKFASVTLPVSRKIEGILNILKKEGFIKDYILLKDANPAKSHFEVALGYHLGKPIISDIKQVSKQGRRVYTKARNLQKFYNGLGGVILSTPAGVITDYEAITQKVGGEVILRVF